MSVDVLVVEEEIVEEDAPWNVPDSTSKSDGGPSALWCIQTICRDHGLSVPFHVQAIQVMVKDALVTLRLSCDSADLFVEQMEVNEKSNSKMKSLPKAPESSQSDAQQRRQELKFTKDTGEKLTGEADKAEKTFAASQDTHGILRIDPRINPTNCTLKTPMRRNM